MTGDEHYQRAEDRITHYRQAIEKIKATIGDKPLTAQQTGAMAMAGLILDEAQVHATLALAAATREAAASAAMSVPV